MARSSNNVQDNKIDNKPSDSKSIARRGNYLFDKSDEPLEPEVELEDTIQDVDDIEEVPEEPIEDASDYVEGSYDEVVSDEGTDDAIDEEYLDNLRARKMNSQKVLFPENIQLSAAENTRLRRDSRAM